jgi:hypothetical protein
VSPTKGGGNSDATVWAIFFDVNDPAQNMAIKRSYPLKALESGKGHVIFQLHHSLLTTEGCQGEISKGKEEMSWHLIFDKPGISLKRYPNWMYHFPFPKTKLVAPAWSTTISGAIRIGKKEYQVRSVPAHYAHYWGPEYAEDWAWAHGNAFDDQEKFVFEGLAARVLLAGMHIGPLKVFTFYIDGHWHLTPLLRGQFSIKSQSDLFHWHFEAPCERFLFVGDVIARPDEMVALRYTTPDGGHRYCHNSTVGDAVIQVFRRGFWGKWKKWRTFTARNSVAFETASPHYDSRVLRIV